MSISDEILKRVVESYRRIRNTLRFLLANTSDFDPRRDALPVAEWLEIDRFALELARALQAELKADYERYEFHLVVKKLVAFCSEDLGAFYLDILKDRLYTTRTDSRSRRSAQHALWHITHCLLRWMAPVLSFTAEEAWEVFSGDGQRSIFEEEWHVLPEASMDPSVVESWRDIRSVRDIANKRVEEKRAQGDIGSSLQAELDIYASGKSYESLARLGEDLKFAFITSRATAHPQQGGDGLRVDVKPSTHGKCERCWHYRPDVGGDSGHPSLCGRCIANLYGAGEPRAYA